jgi:hypothetical protein
MKLHPMLRPILAVVAVLLLLALAYTGISGGVQQWNHWSTMQHRIQLGSQIVSGVSALLILITSFRWRRWRRYAELGFVLGGVVATSLAAVVWGGGTILSGVSTGIAALAITGAIVWMVHAGVDTFALRRKPEN